jgi:hypothetical protein
LVTRVRSKLEVLLNINQEHKMRHKGKGDSKGGKGKGDPKGNPKGGRNPMGKGDTPLSPSKGKNPKGYSAMKPSWGDANVHSTSRNMSARPEWVDTNVHPKGKGTAVQPHWVEPSVNRQSSHVAMPSFEEYTSRSDEHPAPPGYPPPGMSSDAYYWYSKGASGDDGHQRAGNQQNQQNTPGIESQPFPSAGHRGPRYQ